MARRMSVRVVNSNWAAQDFDEILGVEKAAKWYSREREPCYSRKVTMMNFLSEVS
jgi:hypothetical protein